MTSDTAPTDDSVDLTAFLPANTLGENLRPAIVSLGLLTILCGIVYPMAITAIAEVVWPKESHGSLIEIDGRVVGSELIGQSFDDPGYLWGRLSATSPVPYTAFAAATLTGSSGSNLGPTNSAIVDAAKARIARLCDGPHDETPIPADLVTASASGLDPHISPEAARWQAPRIAAARGMTREAVLAVIDAATEGRTAGFLGEPRVNVLLANRALDRASSPRTAPNALRSSP